VITIGGVLAEPDREPPTEKIGTMGRGGPLGGTVNFDPQFLSGRQREGRLCGSAFCSVSAIDAAVNTAAFFITNRSFGDYTAFNEHRPDFGTYVHMVWNWNAACIPQLQTGMILLP
jgi:hypothetical protein